MYQLYGSNGACSMAVHVVLEYVKAPYAYNRIDTMAGEQKKPEFLKINSRGQVPVLVDDGFTIREGAAILTYLCEKEHSDLLPTEGKARATAMEWLAFCNSTLHPAYTKGFMVRRWAVDEAAKKVLAESIVGAINALWQDVEKQLERNAYLAGDKLTVGDILLTVIANWSDKMPLPVTIGSKTKALLQKVVALPAYQKAMQTEQVEYKAAA